MVAILTPTRKGRQFFNQVDSVSCPAPGCCAAAGGNEGFLTSEVRGRWGRAVEVPGLASLTSSTDSPRTRGY